MACAGPDVREMPGENQVCMGPGMREMACVGPDKGEMAGENTRVKVLT